MNHHANIMQATYIWGAAMEKVVEGKESAAEKATLLKEATVEKVNSMKESVEDAIALQSDSPVRNLMLHAVVYLGNNTKFDGLLGNPCGDHNDCAVFQLNF